MEPLSFAMPHPHLTGHLASDNVVKDHVTTHGPDERLFPVT